MNDEPLNILKKEEYYIKTLNPHYNVCTECGNGGGSPNLGRKFTKEWKEKIAAKSKLYKHSPEVLEKVSDNNKKQACKITMTKDNEILTFNS